jgi:hypothetical protein
MKRPGLTPKEHVERGRLITTAYRAAFQLVQRGYGQRGRCLRSSARTSNNGTAVGFISIGYDACLNGEPILTSRHPWHDGARELLRRGYPGDTLLTLRHAGKDYDRIVPLEIGYLAQWSISDSHPGGLKRIRWQPMPEHLKQRRR